MTIEVSESIVLLRLSTANTEELFEVVDGCRDNLSVYLSWVNSVTDIVSAADYINARVNSNESGSEWYAIYFKNQFSGVFGIKYIDPNTRVSELGYWLSVAVRGNGIINQVLDVILPYLASNTDTKIVEFHCLEDNEASIKVVSRAGAKFVRCVPRCVDVLKQEQNIGIYQIEL